jgi:predicted deacylase
MKTVILTAGIHGDEPEGLVLAQQIVRIIRVEAAPLEVIFHGMLNPEGFALGTRQDGGMLDLNREWTTEGNRADSPACDRAWASILRAHKECGSDGVVVVDCHSMDGTPGVFYAGPIGEQLAKGCFHNVARLGAWETKGTLTHACESLGIPAVAVEASKGEGPGALPMAVYRALRVWASYGPLGKARHALIP